MTGQPKRTEVGMSVVALREQSLNCALLSPEIHWWLTAQANLHMQTGECSVPGERTASLHCLPVLQR